MTARNCMVTILTSLFLTGALLFAALESAGIPFPVWLSPEEASYLAGGAPASHLDQNFNVDGFANKKLQKSLEIEIGNKIPAKATALLTHAGIQRGFISLSNYPFGWECYPTFYGSGYVYIPANDAIAKTPVRATKEYEKNLKSFLKGLSAFADSYPEKRFVLFVPPMSSACDENPACVLSKHPETMGRVRSKLESTIEKLPENVLFLTLDYDDAAQYYEDFFATDHHWNANGTVNAYNRIASRLGWDGYQVTGWQDFDDYSYMGSNARGGLMALQESVTNVDADFSNLTIVRDGMEYPYDHRAFENANSLRRRYSFYDTYLDVAGGGSLLLNKDGKNNALVVGNSYAGSIEPYLAMNYASLTVSRQLHLNKSISKLSSDSRLESLVEQSNPDDIYLIAHLDALQNVMKACPDYFKC